MMAGRGKDSPSAGGPARHIPVMLSEVLSALKPTSGETIIDGTFGAGGYSKAILEAADCKIIAIDRDPDAIAAARKLADQVPERLALVVGRYSQMDTIVESHGHATVDGVVLDLGVSSMQLDQPERGFSFSHDGPLDMRMGKEGPSASDIVNELSESELAGIIAVLGEEKRARAIARAIVAVRSERPIARTSELADIVASVLGRRWDETKHPATRTFQALRLHLNEELDELAEGLSAAERVLRTGGRLVVVTFHSLEDRIAKRFFASRSLPGPRGSRHLPQQMGEAAAPSFQVLNRRALHPTTEEIRLNPRARSASLRAGERTEAPPQPLDLAALRVPRVGR